MPQPFGAYRDFLTANTDRIGSPSIWQKAPILQVQLGQQNGMYLYEDWHDRALTADQATVSVVDVAGWDATVATAGTALTTAATSTNRGGILQMDAGDTTADHGIQLQQGLVANWILASSGNEALYFEARVRPSGNVTGDYFMGMCNTDTTINNGTAITTTDHLGFSSNTGNGVMLFAASKASTATTITANTLVADTFVKLGFVVFYSPNAGWAGRYFVDGVPGATALTATNIPSTVAMRPSFVCQNSTTTRARLDIDWVKVLHVYGTAT